MTLHGFFEICFALTGTRRQFQIEGVEPEVIAMRSRGRARSGVTVGAAVVLALYTAARQVIGIGRVFRNVVGRGWNVIDDPVRISAGSRGVGVVHDQNKRSGL